MIPTYPGEHLGPKNMWGNFRGFNFFLQLERQNFRLVLSKLHFTCREEHFDDFFSPKIANDATRIGKSAEKANLLLMILLS